MLPQWPKPRPSQNLRVLGRTSRVIKIEDINNEIFAYTNEKNATIKIHALKSTSRIIGAGDIGELAQKLENAGKANDVDALNAGLGTLLKRARSVGELLKPLLVVHENDDEGRPMISEDILADAYKRIKGFAEDCDNASIEDVLEELSGYSIPDNERARYAAIVEASDNFDFDGIANLL